MGMITMSMTARNYYQNLHWGKREDTTTAVVTIFLKSITTILTAITLVVSTQQKPLQLLIFLCLKLKLMQMLLLLLLLLLLQLMMMMMVVIVIVIVSQSVVLNANLRKQ